MQEDERIANADKGMSEEGETSLTRPIPEAKSAPESTAPASPYARLMLPTLLAALSVLAIAVAMMLLTPPELPADQVLAEFDAAELEQQRFVGPVYTAEDRFHVEGEQVSSIDDNGTGRKVAHMEIALANEGFSVIAGVDRDYELQDRKWVAGEWRLRSVDAAPISPVDGDAVLADIETILSRAPDERGEQLVRLYNGAEFEITDNMLDGLTCVTTIQASRTYVLNRYQGTFKAYFAFLEGETSADGGSWKLISVSAEDGAAEPVLAPVIGAWTGHLVESSSSSLLISTGRCLAAQDESLTLTVSDFDPTTGRMVINASFISHNHAGLETDAPSSEGDVLVGLVSTAVVLDPATLSGSWSPVASSSAQGAYRLDFINEKGIWKLRITSGLSGSEGAFSFGSTSFEDIYELERV